MIRYLFKSLGIAFAASAFAAACGGGQAPPAAAPKEARSAPLRSDAEWDAHCEAVAKRKVSCALQDEEDAALELAICKKTQKCAVQGPRPDAIVLTLECEEKAACEEECSSVVRAQLPPTAAEERLVKKCVAKFPKGDFLCKGLGETVRLVSDDDAVKVEKCVDKASEVGEMSVCGLAAIGGAFASLGCMAEAAPEEMKRALAQTAPRPLPERPKVATFGKGIPVAIGAEVKPVERVAPPPPPPPAPVASKRPKKGTTRPGKPPPAAPAPRPDIHTWTYADLPMNVWYEPEPGVVAEIRLRPKEETEETCKELTRRILEELGPPSRAYHGLGMSRVWKAGDRALYFTVEKIGGEPRCNATLMSKGSSSWKMLIDGPKPMTSPRPRP